jgi:O-antigen/teichoic acid export membrane protein
VKQPLFMPLWKKLGLSIMNMGIQRALEIASGILVTMLVVRSLSREEFGMLSLVLSYGLVFNMLNVSVSSVLLRDYSKLKGRIGEYMRAFLLASLLKSAVVLLLSVAIGLFLHRRYGSYRLIGVLAVTVANTMLLYLVEPFSTLLSVDWRQSILTKISLVSSAANVVLSTVTIWVPTALYVSLKNTAVALIGLILTVHYTRRLFHLRGPAGTCGLIRLAKESFVGFSLWAHLIGVLTDVVYRADLLILGWLGAPFHTVGNYNIALQMGSFAKLLPQILQYNAMLGLNHSQEHRRQEEITFLFLKYSLLLSLVTMAGWILLGRFLIHVIVGRAVEEIYGLGFYIVAGLCLYNTFRPLISYSIVVHDIRECLLFAVLPACTGTLVCYVIMGQLWGSEGMAKANLAGGAIMTATTLFYIRWRTRFRWRFTLVTGYEQDLFAKMRTSLKW